MLSRFAVRTVAILLVLASCSTAPPARGPEPQPVRAAPPAAPAFAALHDRYRLDGLENRRFTHRELWESLLPLIDTAPSLQREDVGRSAEGRPLYLVRYGTGPIPVLLWSQMHGDESTATMALADLLSYLGRAPDDVLPRRLGERLSVWMVPMLNPDGAERFQRRNAQGIDINRDARTLATPEGRVLRELQKRLRPRFGFNLHDQSVRIPVEESNRIVAIALLAPPFDESRSDDEVRLRAARIAAVIRHAVEPLVGGHLARYDDSFNPRAFGDNLQSWGTSTVLIESGGWHDDPEKQYLRMVNFVALLAALDAIATGEYAGVDPGGYRNLPFNGRPVNDLLIRGGTVVAPGFAPFRADLAIDFADPLRHEAGRIVEVGDLGHLAARDTLVADRLYLHLPPEAAAGAPGRPGAPPVALGTPASFVLRRGADPGSEAVWLMEDGRLQAARRE